MSSLATMSRNDLNIINLIVGNYVDPLDESEGIPAQDGRKILEHIHSTMRFWTGCASRLQRKRVTKNGKDREEITYRG